MALFNCQLHETDVQLQSLIGGIDPEISLTDNIPSSAGELSTLRVWREGT